MKKEIITNDEFIEAQNNIDNKKLTKFMLSKYAGIFAPDELESIGNIALWKCLMAHDDSMGQKFTTSLYNHIMWEILSELRKYNKANRLSINTNGSGLIENTTNYNKEIDRIDIKDAIDSIPNYMQDIVYEYYIEKKTLSEISEKYHIGIETTRKRLKQGVATLKDKCS